MDNFAVSARLAFRRFEPTDLEPLAAICADPEVMRFVGDGVPLDRAEVARWIERSRANVARRGYGTGAVVERASARLIGWAGIARPEGAPEELIYGLDRASWRQGYGGELLALLVGHAHATLGLTRLRAMVDPANAGSVALLRRQGFSYITEGSTPTSHLYSIELRRTAAGQGGRAWHSISG